MTIENCFSCLDLKEIEDKDYSYFCKKHNKGIFNPKNAGCESIRLPDKIRWDKRIKMYYDEELGIWY